MNNGTLSQTWNLDVLFAGGSDSSQFNAFLNSLETNIEQFNNRLQHVTVEQLEEKLPVLIQELEQILNQLKEADSFTSCLSAENQRDKMAVLHNGRVKELYARYASALTVFDRLLLSIPEETWEAFMMQESMREIAFPLQERRDLAKEKLPPEQEALISDLAVDGYHGWGELYNTAVSQVRIPFEENGEVLELSAGQAHNKLHSPDREVRKKLFRNWEEAWGTAADVCADALNHLAGFRLQVYKNRGWTSVHKEPLAVNRMSEQTLTVMWDVIDRNKAIFQRYLQRKAEWLGVEKLAWYDLEAPIGNAGKHYTYEEGARLIVDQFRSFSPKMAQFAEMAFRDSWIEAEDRAGKRPGGFCTSFPISKQTRIFMTYAGTASNVATLAHELGHAYHQHVMNDMPALSQEYAMNVAETASTFAEMIVADAALQQAGSQEEKFALLEDKVQRAVTFFMNIHARFMFETNFYEQRKKGLVSVEQLNRLMVDAQKEAYQHSLSEYHPHFWTSKLHFYLTDVPFYNFPYTFGYLFSSGIYAVAMEQGQSFEDQYIALLRDTGSMTVEQLALKHLQVDLQKPDFWQRAVELCVRDAEQLLAMMK